MNIVGLDLSLRQTGIAYPDGSTATIHSSKRGVERLDDLVGAIEAEVSSNDGPDLVVIEGYSFNSRNSGEHLGELGGVVRLTLWRAGIPFIEVPPAVVKKYACGKGNATKEAVLVAAVRRSNKEMVHTDEADAWWLRALALDAYGEPEVDVPAVNREAITRIAWPKLAKAAS